jgi:phosphohistidine phosphatase
MRCYFLRHGIAAEGGEWQGSDFERPLTDEGRKRMTREAETMAALGLDLDLIVTSPLVRAKQTAAIVAKALKLRDSVVENENVGLDFGPSHLWAILREHANANAIMLVGHQPSLSQTVAHLVGGARIDFKKGTLACVNVPDPVSLQGALLWLVPAKVLALPKR